MRSRLVLPLLLALTLLAGCARAPQEDGMGARISAEEAVKMALADSPIVTVTRTDRYTAPPTVHRIYGKDKDGRELIAWVYTTVIRCEYADRLISAERATEYAKDAGFPTEAIEQASLQVIDGGLDGRDRPIFWRLGTHAGFIWIDAETGDVLRRLDAK